MDLTTTQRAQRSGMECGNQESGKPNPDFAADGIDMEFIIRAYPRDLREGPSGLNVELRQGENLTQGGI
jgi:hypothetical protein